MPFAPVSRCRCRRTQQRERVEGARSASPSEPESSRGCDRGPGTSRRSSPDSVARPSACGCRSSVSKAAAAALEDALQARGIGLILRPDDELVLGSNVFVAVVKRFGPDQECDALHARTERDDRALLRALNADCVWRSGSRTAITRSRRSRTGWTTATPGVWVPHACGVPGEVGGVSTDRRRGEVAKCRESGSAGPTLPRYSPLDARWGCRTSPRETAEW